MQNCDVKSPESSKITCGVFIPVSKRSAIDWAGLSFVFFVGLCQTFLPQKEC